VARSTIQNGTVVYTVSYAGGPGFDTLPIDSKRHRAHQIDISPIVSTALATCAGLNMILSGEMTLCRVRQKTKKQLAQKTLTGIRKEMARPREARSAQKKVRRRSSDA
jgi:hypothetical protein